MGKGMKFLLCKPWHPMRYDNQEKKWLEEKKIEEGIKREKERQGELAKERTYWDAKALAGMSTSAAMRIKMQAPVAFLYQAPPTIMQQQEREKKEKENRALGIIPPVEAPVPVVDLKKNPNARDMSRVKCHTCGKFGHFANDKSCPKYNPQLIDEKKLLDPLTSMKAMSTDMADSALGSYDEKGTKLEMRVGNTFGNVNPENLTYIPDDIEEEEVVEPEQSFLQSLSEEQKHAILAQILSEEKEKLKTLKKLKKEEKREKKELKKYKKESKSERDFGHSKDAKEDNYADSLLDESLSSRFVGFNDTIVTKSSGDVRSRSPVRRHRSNSPVSRRRRSRSSSRSHHRRSRSPKSHHRRSRSRDKYRRKSRSRSPKKHRHRSRSR